MLPVSCASFYVCLECSRNRSHPVPHPFSAVTEPPMFGRAGDSLELPTLGRWLSSSQWHGNRSGVGSCWEVSLQRTGLALSSFPPPCWLGCGYGGWSFSITLNHNLGDGGLSRAEGWEVLGSLSLQGARPALGHPHPDFKVNEKQTFNLFGILLHSWPKLFLMTTYRSVSEPRVLPHRIYLSALVPAPHNSGDRGFSKIIWHLVVPLFSFFFKGCLRYLQIFILSYILELVG